MTLLNKFRLSHSEFVCDINLRKVAMTWIRNVYFGHSSPINKRSQQQFVWKVIHARLACNLLTGLKSCSTASFGCFQSFKASTNTCANCSLFQQHSSHTNIWSVMMNDSASTVSCSSAILFLILTHSPFVCFGWIDKIWSLMVTNTAFVCVCACVCVFWYVQCISFRCYILRTQ